MKKYKLVMISGNGYPIICGISDYTANLISTLQNNYPEFEIIWVCRRSRWFHSPFSRYRNISLIRPTHAWNDWGTSLTINWLKWLKPDLVHIQDQIHSFFETDAAVKIAKSVNCPVVVTLHEFHEELASVKHTIELVNLATAITANDQRTTSRCQQYTGKTIDFQGWSPSNLVPLESIKKVQTVPGLITTFGLITPNKQLPIIFETLKILRQQGFELSWQIIGPFTPDTNSYHASLQKMLDAPWVNFTGGFENLQDPQLQTRLAQTDIMVLPFADGASPRRTSLQSSWAFGLPVVTTPPPTEEVNIQDGINCLLVGDNEPMLWSQTIKTLLESPELKEKLRAGSYTTAQIFSWENLTNLHYQLYQNSIKS